MTLERIIKTLARQHHTSPKHIRREMEAALEEAKKSDDPAVQARWATIPHSGDSISLEDFINYIALLAKFSS